MLGRSCGGSWPLAGDGSPAPYLNSGCIAGFAPDLADLLARARRELRAGLRAAGAGDGPQVAGDQELLCHMYANASHEQGGAVRERLRLGLDVRSAVFLNMHAVDEAREVAIGPDRRIQLTGELAPTVRSTTTHQRPRPSWERQKQGGSTRMRESLPRSWTAARTPPPPRGPGG